VAPHDLVPGNIIHNNTVVGVAWKSEAGLQYGYVYSK